MIDSDNLTFYGHSMHDYIRMFDLGHAELDMMHVLDCSGHYSSFSYEMGLEGHKVVVANPFFATTASMLRNQLKGLEQRFHDHVASNLDAYFLHHATLDAEMAHRHQVSDTAIQDLESSLDGQRYSPQDLTQLNYADESFDLALSSHFLFTYSDELTLEYHQAAIQEMLRVADELRIFPLITHQGKPSPHLGPILQWATTQGMSAELQQVPYEFQKGGNAMLIIDKDHCEIGAHHKDSH